MKYVKVSKANYIIEHIAEPLVYSITYTIAFFWTRKWVKKHEGQKRAWG